MKYEYSLGLQEKAILKSLVGKRLESYRLNDTDNTSFEIFVLRFPDLDVELATKEIVGVDGWFEETNTTEVVERPGRDSWSRVGRSDPDNGIPEGGFMDYPVGKIITGISAVIETLKSGDESGEFVRGLILDFGEDTIVFDKGAYRWDSVWTVSKRVPSESKELPRAEFDPVEEVGLSSRTRFERI